MNFNGHRGDYIALYNDLLKAACKTNVDVINGRPIGKNPRFFIVGDEPGFKDYITGVPFSGPLNEVLLNCVQTLEKRYGAKETDCYVTYLIKTSFKQGQLTEKMVINEWLPIAQLEYALSGCEQVVAVGRIAKMFAAHITVKPKILLPQDQPLHKKVWKFLTRKID